MAKKFDIGDFAKTLAQPVPESDTGREQIEYISVDLLDDDPNNFYSLRDLDELAANIATVGLQQPIRVRDGENGRVVIVSGHRRTAAIRMLVADGRDDLREVPCIRERGEVSPALQELRLLYANSSTRALTSAEISRQVERVRDLLYQLKEEGYEFTGRMRDHVAEACKISKSKLARLDVIRKKLAPDIRKAYWDSSNDGCLSEDAAYTLARLPVAIQREVVDAYRSTGKSSGLRYMYAGLIEDVANTVEKIISKKVKCLDGGDCSHRDAQIAHAVKFRMTGHFGNCGCEYGCCATCSTLPNCKSVCPKMLGKQKKLKSAAKAERRQAAVEKAARERPEIERIGSIWQRFGSLREQAGLTPKQYFKLLDCEWSRLSDKAESYESGAEKLTPETELPFGYNVHLSDIDRYVAAADALGCSVDYLMMRTDEPRTADAVAPVPRPVPGQTVLASWMPGGTTPAEPCDVVADIDLGAGGGETKRMTCIWNGREFCIGKKRKPIDMAVVRWIALPPVEKEDKNDD
nr:MAG TPA: chromosome partitioning protein [Caudoviricetes sp.]